MLFLPVLLKISCLLSSLTCCSLATTGATSTISDNLNNKYRLLFQQHVKNSVFHSPSLLSTPPLSPSSSSSSSSINPVIPVLETVYALDLSHIQHLAVNVSGFNGAVVDVRTAPSPPESNITGPPETAPPPTVLLSLVIEAPTSSLPSKNTKSSSSSSLLSGGDIQTRLTISGNKASLLISKLLSSSSSSSPPPIQGVVAVSILFPYSSTFATNYSLDISTSSSGIINMANIPPSSSKDYSIRLHTVRLSTADQQNQNQEWLRWEQADDESATVPGGVGAINLNNVAAHSLYLKSVLVK